MTRREFGHVGPASRESREVFAGTLVHRPDRERSATGALARDPHDLPLDVPADDSEDRCGVSEDRRHLRHRRRRVGRHHDAARVPRGEVRHGPLVPGRRHDDDGVTRDHSGGEEAPGEPDDVVDELEGR